MKLFVITVFVLSAIASIAAGATINVVPNPAPGELSLDTALELANPGDEILLAPGSYSGKFTVDKSVEIKGEAGAEVIAEEDFAVAFTITGGRVTMTGLALKGKGTGIVVTGNADLEVDHCRFFGLGVGLHLADGRGKISNCEFDSCGKAVVACVRLQVAGCAFTKNEVGLDAQYGASVRISGCSFGNNERAIIGEAPCQVDGEGNRFFQNGLDLTGAVSPELRPHDEGTEMSVEYPSTAYPSLQVAIDAVQMGGTLMITGPFSDSAVIDHSINVLPSGSSFLGISGHPTDGRPLPVFSVIGNVNVEIERLRVHGGIAVGPQAKLSLTNVSIINQPLELTGNSELDWHGGSGGLHIGREATATIEGATLTGEPALQVEGMATADLTHCIISSSSVKTAVSVKGNASLRLARSFVVGTLTLNDRSQVRVNDSSIGGSMGSNSDRPRFAIELAGPGDLTLNNVEIGSAWVGIYLSADAQISLAGVRIRDTHVGMGVENCVSEFDFPFGLWTPKVLPEVVVEGSGVTLSNNDVDFAPAATQAPWPVGFYESVYGDRKPDPLTAQAIDSIAQAAKAITSCHLRVHDDYSWMAKVEEIYYLFPYKLRIDIYESDKLVETTLSNGHTLWDYKVLRESATKIDLDSLREEFPDSLLSVIRERTRFDPTFADLYLPSVVYLGTEQIDGDETYVFSGTPIRGAIRDEVKMKVWISPHDGIWRKIVYYTTRGKAFLTKTVLTSDTNVVIPDGAFELQLPEATDVRDETR